jgi:hypothetical protein
MPIVFPSVQAIRSHKDLWLGSRFISQRGVNTRVLDIYDITDEAFPNFSNQLGNRGAVGRLVFLVVKRGELQDNPIQDNDTFRIKRTQRANQFRPQYTTAGAERDMFGTQRFRRFRARHLPEYTALRLISAAVVNGGLVSRDNGGPAPAATPSTLRLLRRAMRSIARHAEDDEETAAHQIFILRALTTRVMNMMHVRLQSREAWYTRTMQTMSRSAARWMAEQRRGLDDENMRPVVTARVYLDAHGAGVEIQVSNVQYPGGDQRSLASASVVGLDGV